MLYRLLSRLGAEKYLSSSYFSSWLILAIDTVVSVFSTFVAYLLIRGLFPHPVFTVWYGVWLLAGSCVLSVITFILFRTFRSVIRHTTLREVWKLGAAVLLKDVLMFVYVQLFPQSPLPPQTAIALGFMLDVLVTLFLLLALRLGMIIFYDLLKLNRTRHANCRQVLVYGTGDKSVSLITRLQNSPHYRVIGFLTYGKRLKNHAIADRPVYYFEDESSIEYLRDRVDIDAILFATNDDAQSEQERLIKYCTEKSVKILITPPIDGVIDGKIMKQSIREIKIEDLLGRPEIKISMEEIVANFKDKTIFVTGAAGSIGSELCRQLVPVLRVPFRQRGDPDAQPSPGTGGALSGIEIHPCHRRRPDSRPSGLRVPDVPSAGGVPRCGLQTRPADGGEPMRGGSGKRRGNAQRR